MLVFTEDAVIDGVLVTVGVIVLVAVIVGVIDGVAVLVGVTVRVKDGVGETGTFPDLLNAIVNATY